MTPVISPLVFYLMPIASKVQGLALSVGIVLLIATSICFLIFLFELDLDEELSARAMAAAKKLIVPTIVAALVFVVTPSSTTITKMLIAQNVTHERVETVADTVESVYNDIMGLFEESEDE